MGSLMAIPGLPLHWHVIYKGKVVEGADSNVEILKFGADDVFIKGETPLILKGTRGSGLGHERRHHRHVLAHRDSPGAHLIQPIGWRRWSPASRGGRAFRDLSFQVFMGLPGKIVPVTAAK